MIIKIGDRDQSLAINPSISGKQASGCKVTILADYAIHAEDVDIDKAHEAQKRAEEILKRKKSQLSEQDSRRSSQN